MCSTLSFTDPLKNFSLIRVWEGHIFAYAHGDQINTWFSEYLKIEHLSLVCFGDAFEPRKSSLEATKNANIRSTDEVMFADYAPLMLMSEASIADLNSRLESNVSAQNFRPNILVADCEAYDEVCCMLYCLNNEKMKLLFTAILISVKKKSVDQKWYQLTEVRIKKTN